VAAAAEQQYGLPAGSIVRALFPQGWPWDEPTPPPALQRAQEIWRHYLGVWFALDNGPADCAERAEVRRRLATAERRWRTCAVQAKGLRVSPRGQRVMLDERLAALYTLLAPTIPAQRRVGLDAASRRAPRNFKHDAARETARLATLAYGECSPYVSRDVLSRSITLQTVKNAMLVRAPAR
jgi:hypothetical protein